MQILGAEDDNLVSQRQIRRTAALYNTQAEFFPTMGHAMILDTGWQAVAERIIRWLDTTFPAPSTPTQTPK